MENKHKKNKKYMEQTSNNPGAKELQGSSEYYSEDTPLQRRKNDKVANNQKRLKSKPQKSYMGYCRFKYNILEFLLNMLKFINIRCLKIHDYLTIFNSL